MVGLSASSLESDLGKRGRKTFGQFAKEEDVVRRRTTFFWDIQRMVITSVPNMPNGQRRPLAEYRKPEVMSKERAMAVLGLGVKKVNPNCFKAFNTSQQGEKGLPEAVKLSEYTEEDLLRAFRRESYILGQRQITA